MKRIKLEAIKAEVVDEYLEKFGLSKAGTIGERVDRLQAQQREVTPAGDLGDCLECGAECDVNLPVCPFCGVGDEPEQPPAPAKKPAQKSGQTPAKGKKRSQAAPDKKAAPKKADKAIVPESPVEIVDSSEGPAAGLTTKDLDKSVEQIQGLKTQAAVRFWELGKALFECFEKRLYKLRTSDAGVPVYKSWNQFVVAECGIIAQRSYEMMNVAVAFDRKTVEEVGSVKLQLIAKLPPEERDALLEQVKSGLPKSKVAEEVRRLADGKPSQSPIAKKNPTTADAAKSTIQKTEAKKTEAVAKKNEVAAVVVLGRKTITLSRADKPDMQAQTMAHGPNAEEYHLNGILTRYQIVKQAKGLALVITRQRLDKAQQAEREETPKEPEAKKKSPKKIHPNNVAKKAAKKAPAKKAPAKKTTKKASAKK